MPSHQPLPGPYVDENVPLLPVAHIMPKHLAGISGQLHGLHSLGCTRDMAPGPAVVPGSVLGIHRIAYPVLLVNPSIERI